MNARDSLVEASFPTSEGGACDTDDPALDPLHEESPQAEWERVGLEDAWVNDYSPRRGFAG